MEIEYVQSILCLLYNIARCSETLPAFYSTSTTIDILVSFAHCPLDKIGLYAKCVLCFLQFVMEDDQLHNLELLEAEVSFFEGNLSNALKSEGATGGGFTAEEILTIVIKVCSVEKNRTSFQTQSIFATLDEGVSSSVYSIKTLSVRLIFSLTVLPICSVNAFSLSQRTVECLKKLEEDPVSSIRSLAHYLLHHLSQEAQNGRFHSNHMFYTACL